MSESGKEERGKKNKRFNDTPLPAVSGDGPHPSMPVARPSLVTSIHRNFQLRLDFFLDLIDRWGCAKNPMLDSHPNAIPSFPFFFAILFSSLLCLCCTPPSPTGVCFAPLGSNGLLINLSSSHPSIPASLRLMFLDFSLFVHFTIIPLRNCISPELLTIFHWTLDSTSTVHSYTTLSPVALSVFFGCCSLDLTCLSGLLGNLRYLSK